MELKIGKKIKNTKFTGSYDKVVTLIKIIIFCLSEHDNIILYKCLHRFLIANVHYA